MYNHTKERKMMNNGIIFDIDYSKIKVLEEYNSKQMSFPVVLSVPHSGTFFPPEFLQKINTPESVLHKNEDSFVDELLKEATDAGICTVKMNVSRVFVDANRDKDELDTAMFFDYPYQENSIRSKRCRYGIGLIHRIDAENNEIYPAPISYKETLLRIEKIYDVYHKRLNSCINACVKKFGFCLVIDVHSMPSKICTIVDSNNKIDCCIGDLFEQSCPAEIVNFFEQQLEQHNLTTIRNIPYSGAYITFNYCQPKKKVYSLQLEINRSLYMDEKSTVKNADFSSISDKISSSLLHLSKKIIDFKF